MTKCNAVSGVNPGNRNCAILLVVIKGSEREVLESGCFVGTGFPFGVIKMFRN